MQRCIIIQICSYLFIVLNFLNTCSAAKFPDDGYVNPPPPPKEGYDVPEEGYDAPEAGYDAPEDVKGNKIYLNMKVALKSNIILWY